MAEYGSKAQQTPDASTCTPRWKKFHNLPPETRVWDMSTGEVYKMGELRPLYKDAFQSQVEVFQHKHRPQLEIYVPFLRLVEDKRKCSLMKKGLPNAQP